MPSPANPPSTLHGMLALSVLTLSAGILGSAPSRERSSSVPPLECQRVSRALSRYRVLAAEDDRTLLPATQEGVEPGEYYEGVPRLIRLLSLLGDLSNGATLAEEGLYDGDLVTAVKRFQIRHGLEPDGRLDATTVEQLNTPLSVRVHELELASERCRRLPYDPRRPAIVVNLPEFRLRAYGGGDGEQDPELEMKVVVGQGPDHKSPVLVSQLETVIFRPYWNVPPSILRNELLIQIAQDRSWVSANNFELVTPQGEVAGDGEVSDELFTQLSNGELQLRQKPGPKNTLGLVKFLFSNEYGIYMHDTSAKWLFEKERRDLSHGCIRVEKPVELAEWILAGQAGWPIDRIEDAIQGTETIAVKVKRPVQVVILYSTVTVTKDGEVHFFKDIYGENERLEQRPNDKR